jgi:autotransporter translocation and assembly factor TamB
MLAELIAGTLAKDIKETTGLDILDIEAAGGDAQTAEGTRVTLGKTLSRRVAVKYESETGTADIVQRAVAEYRLLERLMIKGYQDNQGRFGGALQYRLEFR